MTNTDVVLHYYELVDANDVPALLALFADDAAYHRPGYDPLVGQDMLRHFYQDERVIAAGHHHVDQLVAGDHEIAVNGTFTGTLRDSTDITLRFADFFRLNRTGLIYRRDTFFFAPLV
ncbi:nuclear transport factor 2 family protein [Actinokineospora inagensis]|uniref:nuclear transport factor 2 family protein n=1 Tax=Actinokineospora inagensis TaxID=103730 RepID=UPI0004143206|nr:nuclear transport factor 2 family protein [Actinokineospora inagensis]